ncbi:MAG TPA: TonB family protein [Devosia sp.]|jgi:protein TonB|nr:TonB family protein [Devosia sp.]
MRLTLPGSVLVHTGLLGALLVGFAWPEPEDAAAPAPVTVNIVPMSSVSSSSSEMVESNSTVSALSAGQNTRTLEPQLAETVEPVEAVVEPEVPEALEPLETETARPVEPAAVAEAPEGEPVQAELAEAAEDAAIELAELSSTALNALTAAPAELARSETVEPAAPLDAASSEPVESAGAEALEPVSVGHFTLAPVPHTLSLKRPSEPIVHKPAPQRATSREPRPAPQTAGNGGTSQADAVAAAGGSKAQQSNQGSGGQAEEARYKSMVQNRLRQSMGRYSGRGGDMMLSFTILADGRVSGVHIGGTSDHGLTQAATALLQRAAPFPPIPPETGLSSWPFRMPLTFRGR